MPSTDRLKSCIVCLEYALYVVDRKDPPGKLQERTHLALPLTDKLRMSLPGMLGIFSSVLL